MTEHEFTLADRIAKIKSINEQYDLENNAYIAFSGGKDSTVLHYLIDEALPGNEIPRVFINTGIEYKLILKFTKQLAETDNRFVIKTVGKNIKETLNIVGWPFKSKEHSNMVYEWQKGHRSPSVMKYFRFVESSNKKCPYALIYQTTDSFTLKLSRFCCNEFKKKPIHQYEKESGKTVGLTGMTRTEGGERIHLNCAVFKQNTKTLERFHPLAPVSNEWEDWYIKRNRIQLCDLYYPPYSFSRTGCKGCPYSLHLQAQLDTLKELLPDEYKQSEYLWKTVYDEYRRIGYRLRKEDNQPTLFD